MKEDRDSLLVHECLKGNVKAFEELVDAYQRPLFNTACRILNDAAEAEDVTQNVFIKAYEKLSTFDTRQKFFSWLYKIAVNESLNAVQRTKRFVELDEQISSRQKEGDDLLYDSQIGSIVHDAVSRLQIEYRTVIVLKHFQQLSYSEISEILDVPEKTVKSRLFTARNLLRESMVKQGQYHHE